MVDKELMVNSIGINEGKLELNLSGEPIHTFYAAFLEAFVSSGAENFLTVTIGYGGDKFEVSIVKSNGVLTPAERIEALEDELRIVRGE